MRGGCPIKPLFIHGPSPGFRMVLCTILAALLLFVDLRYTWMEKVRTEASTVVAPVQWLVSLPAEAMSWGATAFSSQRALVEENRALREQLTRLSQRSLRMDALTEENVQLRQLMHAAPQQQMQFITSELMRLDNDPFIQQMIVNRGADHGVYQGQPVVDAFGVVGHVVSVGRFSSRVMMISDPSNAMPVQLVRNGLRFVIQGVGGPHHLQLVNVPANADVREGDLLVTSGLGGEFPPGYPVATVTKVESRTNGPFAKVEARPAAQLDRSRDFLMLSARDAVSTDSGARVEQATIDAIDKLYHPAAEDAPHGR
ncbi:rod shape-determining protein MreC [Carnimonas nigrificans]|uniref:rod shape-determining protein MreC n=1 Tax=Carnimonas nigrificans TaxID=64323 RepID=UPI000A0174D3|nr:rod shape-determining protein MreC [Carnimonas nigrificans]